VTPIVCSWGWTVTPRDEIWSSGVQFGPLVWTLI
jgi:hypothetical protein